MRKLSLLVCAFLLCSAPPLLAQSPPVVTPENFQNPPIDYRPIATFRGAGGDPQPGTSTVTEELKAILDLGYGGVMFAPTSNEQESGMNVSMEGPSREHLAGGGYGLHKTHDKGQSPWVQIAPPAGEGPFMPPPPDPAQKKLPKPHVPDYLSREYFDQLRELLSHLKASGAKAVFYDEAGFPSGLANHTTPREISRKYLSKHEEHVVGPKQYTIALPSIGALMAVVAMNTQSLERIDLTPRAKDKTLTWNVPDGDWKVMVFNAQYWDKPSTKGVDYKAAVDYLDPDAVTWFLDQVYEPHRKQVGEYFGNTINMSFFDDVGIFDVESTWSYKFNDAFKQLLGKDAAVYYPALWKILAPKPKPPASLSSTPARNYWPTDFPR